MISNYDAYICEGEMQSTIAKALFGKSKVYTTFNGIPKKQFEQAQQVTANLNSKNLLFIGAVDNDLRLWYKGLDIMVKAFETAYKKDNELTFTLIGISAPFQVKLLEKVSDEVRQVITFIRYTDNIYDYIERASLYFHCSRGDAFPTTILISMAASLPALVSNWTGTRDILKKVEDKLVCELKVEVISERILWYVNLSTNERKIIALKLKKLSDNYTESKALENYKKVFSIVARDLRQIDN